MQRWGVTAAGSARFRCPDCLRSAIRRRPDHAYRAAQSLFLDWLIRGQPRALLARHLTITARTLQNRFQPLWAWIPLSPAPTTADGLILDATSVIKHRQVVLIARDPHGLMTWAFAPRETYESWRRVLIRFEISPRFVVCDGHTGLLKALREVWPQTLIQRCLIHVMRQARLDLTQHPKTTAGRRLRVLVNALTDIQSEGQKTRWLRIYRLWLRRYDDFLREKTLSPSGSRHWWYTHRKLRGVRSLISNSLPDLFHFIHQTEMPRTTNHVEGGINSRIKDLFRRHRGLSPDRKTALVAWYLTLRNTPRESTQKPTRNFL